MFVSLFLTLLISQAATPAKPDSAAKPAPAAKQDAVVKPDAAVKPGAAGKPGEAAKSPANGPVVYAEPNPALPGQTVRIHWPSSLGAVVLSGGKFGAKTSVKGVNWAEDKPVKTTIYAVAEEAASLAKDCSGKGANSAPKRTVVTVHVLQGAFPKLATYTDTRGWRVDVITGWNRYVVSLPDPANNALIYFEKDEDDVERVAVSMVPADGMTSAQLMRKVETEIPTQYDMLVKTGLKETTQGGIDAAWMTFTGTEVSHPNTPSKSMVLAFVKGPRGYVISARTAAKLYDQREQLLRGLVRSFAFVDRPVVPADPAKKPVVKPRSSRRAAHEKPNSGAPK